MPLIIMAGVKSWLKMLLGVMGIFVSSSLFLRYRSIPVVKEVLIINHDVPPARAAEFQGILSWSIQQKDIETNNTERQTPKDVDKWFQGVLKLHQKFEPVTSDSCRNDQCLFEDEVCNARTFEQWERILTSDKLKAVRLFPKEESIFPWDEEYLSQPPLNDTKLLPDLKLSGVRYLHGGKPRSIQYVNCKKNDRLSFHADLMDSYGNRRQFGGDDVRAWITDGERTRSMTGSVKDLQNGTYLITVIPNWTGNVELNVAVVYPREYLRAALYHMKEGRHRFIFGLFKNRNASEVTICHTTPNIPGRPCVCNFTTWNRRPYYCGRPFNGWLSCKDWVAVRSSSGPIATDYTPAEEAVEKQMSRSQEAATIKHSTVIEVEESDKSMEALRPCVDFSNRSMTWDHESPRGIWIKGESWESLVCKEPAMTSAWVRSCLKSTSIWMIGDSNLHHLDDELKSFITFNALYTPKGMWSREKSWFSSEYNIKDTFRGHEYPLFHYLTAGWVDLMDQGGVEDFFAKIPPSGNQVVIIHYNLHFAISHLSALFQRLLSVRTAVRDLLKRNPLALVAIRGPHVSSVEWERNHLFGGDVQGKFILRLLNVVFADLKDKIVFLDGWDMTTSFKNKRMHPPGVVPKAMLRTLLSFRCS